MHVVWVCDVHVKNSIIIVSFIISKYNSALSVCCTNKKRRRQRRVLRINGKIICMSISALWNPDFGKSKIHRKLQTLMAEQISNYTMSLKCQKTNIKVYGL